MKRKLIPLALAALALPALADSTELKLDFEGLGDGQEVLGAYAGGGVGFSAGTYAQTSHAIACGSGAGDFSGGAAGSACGAITLASDTSQDPVTLTMRVAVNGGFNSAFSVMASALRQTQIGVTLFGQDGNTALASGSFGGFDGSSGCNNDFCHWQQISLDLNGGDRAYYVELTAPQFSAYFDDMSFVSSADSGGTPGVVPEPGSVWLGAAALGAMMLVRRSTRISPR